MTLNAVLRTKFRLPARASSFPISLTVFFQFSYHFLTISILEELAFIVRQQSKRESWLFVSWLKRKLEVSRVDIWELSVKSCLTGCKRTLLEAVLLIILGSRGKLEVCGKIIILFLLSEWEVLENLVISYSSIFVGVNACRSLFWISLVEKKKKEKN